MQGLFLCKGCESMKKISIDDGHGDETAGKRTPKFADGTIMKENEFNKIVAGYLEVALKRCGFAVVQTSQAMIFRFL